ncbi:MAG: PEGA domain-containing protein [Polyangiales bacterium]
MRLSLALLAFALALPSLAGAQPAPFEEHLRRGVELRRAGRDLESIAEFEAAHRLSPEPRASAQLGLACQAVGRWLDADRLLREALAAPDDAWVARNRTALDRALAVVAGHVGRLEVSGDVPGAEVRVDGALVGTLPMAAPAPVLAGLVTLDVTAPSHEPVSRRFTVEPGALVRESVTLRPVAPAVVTPPVAPPVVAPPVVPPPVVPPPAAPSRSTARLAWGIASLAGGAVALGLGGVALGLRDDAADRYNTHSPGCPAPGTAAEGSDCADLESTERAWRTTAWVAFPVGAALVTTGALLLLLPPRREGRASVQCAPDVASAGLACAGRF